MAGSESYRDSIRINVYGSKYLFIFEPTKPLAPLSPDELNDAQNSVLGQKKVTGLVRDFSKSLTFAFLPVKLVKKIERRELIPAIDSLSVYRYLNSGTFRPIWSIGGGRDELNNYQNIASLSLPLPYEIDDFDPRLIGFPVSNPTKAIEQPYAAVIRLVFQKLIGKGPFPTLTMDVFPILISPIQLETAAALFAQDQGFVPDFYIGGSLDRVDVRARKPIPIQLKGLTIKPSILEIQCKNYQSTEEPQDKSILIFEPMAPGTSGTLKNEDDVGAQSSTGCQKVYLDRIVKALQKNLDDMKIGSSHLVQWYEAQEQLIKDLLFY
jgi:hypothetical protein